MTETDQPFRQGGLVQPAVPVNLAVDECVIRLADAAAGRWRCSRLDPDHITASHPDGDTAVPGRGEVQP